MCRCRGLVGSRMLELVNNNNFFRISAALNDTVVVWAVVTHTHKNLSMSKKSRSCFDRCSSAKGLTAPKNKKHLLKLREGHNNHIHWTLTQISSYRKRKKYMKNKIMVKMIDYTLKASKFFIKHYCRILSSRNDLWIICEDKHSQLYC